MHLVRNSSRLPALDALALVLLFERFNGNSPYRHYLCFLPRDNGSPVFWEDSQVYFEREGGRIGECAGGRQSG